MATLSEVTTPVDAGGQFQVQVPAGWKQGRGAYGGFSIGAMVRAIEARIGDPARRVKSVTAKLPAPLDVGAATIDVDVLRAGNSVTTARALLQQNGEVCGHATAALAVSRVGAGPSAWSDFEPPTMTPWKQLPAVPMDAGMPEFAQHFEYRVVEGVPFSKARPARTVGWIRPRLPGSVRDAAYIASMIDAWYPAAMVRLEAMRPMVTLAFTLDIVGPIEGLDPESPLLYRGTVPYCGDGYFLETRELWGEDGRLIAINQQTFVIIGV